MRMLTLLTVATLTVFCLIIPAHAQNRDSVNSEEARIDVLGSWKSEPILGQLGRTQLSFTFNQDSTYSSTTDFLSFCDGPTPAVDCEYFWMVQEGSYSTSGEVLTVNAETTSRVLLLTGQTEPDISDMGGVPFTTEFLIEYQDGNVVLTDLSTSESESVILRPDN